MAMGSWSSKLLGALRETCLRVFPPERRGAGVLVFQLPFCHWLRAVSRGILTCHALRPSVPPHQKLILRRSAAFGLSRDRDTNRTCYIPHSFSKLWVDVLSTSRGDHWSYFLVSLWNHGLFIHLTCFNLFQSLFILMLMLFHLWPVGVFSSWLLGPFDMNPT